MMTYTYDTESVHLFVNSFTVTNDVTQQAKEALLHLSV